MPQFVLTSDCRRVIEGAGVSEAELIFAADRISCFSIAKDFTRLTLASWVSDDRFILVDGTITKSRLLDGRPIVELMSPPLVLALRPDLPTGRITREHEIEELLAHAAESFGVPVRCHPDLLTPFSGAGIDVRPYKVECVERAAAIKWTITPHAPYAAVFTDVFHMYVRAAGCVSNHIVFGIQRLTHCS